MGYIPLVKTKLNNLLNKGNIVDYISTFHLELDLVPQILYSLRMILLLIFQIH